RLEMAVEHAALVRRLEPLGDLLHDRQRLLDRERAHREPERERLARDQFHLDDAPLFDLPEAEQHRDVGMIERGEHAGLALEARVPVAVGDQRVAQNLERHLAAQRRVLGAIDLSHSAGAEQREQTIGADRRSRNERHRSADYTSAISSTKSASRRTSSLPNFDSRIPLTSLRAESNLLECSSTLFGAPLIAHA